MTRSPCQTFPKSRVFPVIITKRTAFVNCIVCVFGPFFRLQTICLQKVFIFHCAERLLDVFEDCKETFFKKVLYRGCGGRAPDISCLSTMREHRQKTKKATQSRGFRRSVCNRKSRVPSEPGFPDQERASALSIHILSFMPPARQRARARCPRSPCSTPDPWRCRTRPHKPLR